MRSRKSLERPYYTDSQVDTLCSAELASVGLLPLDPSPIRIDRFVEKRFGNAHQYAELEEGILGFTRFGPNGVEEIVVAEFLEKEGSKSAERRLRSTLAHEAGHGLLHAGLFEIGTAQPLFGDWSQEHRPRVLCRDAHHPIYTGNWWELQANMVMGALLLPRDLVEKAVGPFLEDIGSLGLRRVRVKATDAAVRSLSDIFEVNPIVVRIRLSKLFPTGVDGQLTL